MSLWVQCSPMHEQHWLSRGLCRCTPFGLEICGDMGNRIWTALSSQLSFPLRWILRKVEHFKNLHHGSQVISSVAFFALFGFGVRPPRRKTFNKKQYVSCGFFGNICGERCRLLRLHATNATRISLACCPT